MSAATEPSCAIRWDGIGLTYRGPPDVEALRPTTIEIDAGGHLAITGPSGSGKSTLLTLLGLLDRPTSGRYFLEGRDVYELGERARAELRARYFGFVFQRFHLLSSLTAVENVELALLYGGAARARRREEALVALDWVGLVDRAQHRPAELSGGEQQRVAIARATVRDQQFLLADEPTGNLDSVTAANILDLLEALATGGRTLIYVNHDDGIAQRAARRVRLLDGVVEETYNDPGPETLRP